MSNFDLSVLFFLQLAVILAVCRAVGWAARLIGQPQVVGEMLAGVLLGPSLLGLFFPGVQAALFPAASMTIIYAVAQVGIALYMFLVGAEFKVALVKARGRTAASVSAAGIVVPLVLGGALALAIAGDTRFFSAETAPWQGALFMGAAMAITAFPMLARIIQERGMSGTSLGTLALGAGAINDAAAWCVLAIVLASFAGDASIAIVAIGGGLAFALFTMFVVRPALRPLGAAADRRGFISPAVLSTILVLVMFAAWFTDYIRIYAVFGAFIMGLAMPRGVVTSELQRRLEPMTTSFLVPLFFVYSGLNTSIALLDSPYLWAFAALVFVVACAGKGVGCWLAARLNGETQREAIAIGTLMNARGLVELILLNIGLELGIITPTLFTVMVIMAIGTTLMATPVFELVYGRHRRQAEPPHAAGAVPETV